jgi:hypothetical protein
MYFFFDTFKVHGAGQRLIWCCKQGRLRDLNSLSLQVRS